MAREHTGTNRERSEYYGALQDIVNALFAPYGDLDPTVAEAIGAKVRRLDVVVAAEAADLPDELLRIVTLLPPGDYTRPAPVHPAEQRHRRPRLGPGIRHSGIISLMRRLRGGEVLRREGLYAKSRRKSR